MKKYKFKVIYNYQPTYNKELTVEGYNHEHALHVALLIECPFDSTDYDTDDAAALLMEDYGIELQLLCTDC